MPIIDVTRCIGCGQCEADCVRELWKLRNGKAQMQSGICIDCGHCLAVCPTNAIRFPEYDDKEIITYTPEAFDIRPQKLLNSIKFRRSIRRFKQQHIEDEKISMLLEAGRYAPTGANVQRTRYIILQNHKEHYISTALKTLYDAASKMEKDITMKSMLRYQAKWTKLYRDWEEHRVDGLFYHADIVLLIVSTTPSEGSGELDAALAAANIELMAHVLDLGACYIGFFKRAIELNPQLGQELRLGKKEKLIATLAIGYPSVQYYRTVNRKSIDAVIY